MFEDKQLVNRLKNGDKDALRRIYQKYGDSLLAIAVGIVRDRGMAEDVLHDVFLSFVRNINCFVLTGKLKSYLVKCVSNRAIDLLRLKDNQTINLGDMKTIITNRSLPDQEAEKQEELKKLDNALDQLPIEQRQVIMMYIHGQMGYRQIALARGESVNTIQGRYRYGMNKLKSLLLGG